MWKPILCALGVVASVHSAVAAELYTVTDLTSQQRPNFVPLDANNSGEAVGYVLSGQNQRTPAFFKDGVLTELSVPESSAQAVSVDDAGNIAISVAGGASGYYHAGGFTVPMTVAGGTFTPTLAGNGYYAGYANLSDFSGPALYHNGSLERVSTDFIPVSVNDNGNFLFNSGVRPAYVITNGIATELPAVQNGSYDAISNNGLIAGHVIPVGSNTPGFFILNHGAVNFIPGSQAGMSFAAIAINSSGLAVGSGINNQAFGPALYDNGTFSFLKEDVAQNSWIFERPVRISDNGTIYLIAEAARLTPRRCFR